MIAVQENRVYAILSLSCECREVVSGRPSVQVHQIQVQKKR